MVAPTVVPVEAADVVFEAAAAAGHPIPFEAAVAILQALAEAPSRVRLEVIARLLPLDGDAQGHT